jgi:uncharacterized protein DUF4157
MEMERLFGADFSGVRIHEGGAAAALGAEAYTRGEDLHFARGRFAPGTRDGRARLGHELAHVVQQRAGRVQPLAGPEATLVLDRSLESEADEQGERVARGDRTSLAGADAPRRSGGAVVQPKLGFEIEMLVLVDSKGRPLPEKVPLGTVGSHLELTVDQNSQVEGPTPTAPDVAEAAHQVPGKRGPLDVGRYDLPADSTLGGFALIDAGGKPVSKHPTKLEADTAFAARNRNQTIVRIDKSERTNKERKWAPGAALLRDWKTVRWEVVDSDDATASTHPTEGEARAAHELANRGDSVKPYFVKAGKETFSHPHGPGMGGEKYASIVEIVTKAYEPETPEGRAAIVEAMTDAAKFAGDVEAATRGFTKRVKLAGVGGAAASHDDIHIGNENVGHQSTDASIQSTLGLDIAQLASYVRSALRYASGAPFAVKHHSDKPNPEQRGLTSIPRVFEELPKAVDDAAAVINEIGRSHRREWSLFYDTSSLVNMRGLLTLISQYLRMGRYFYNESGKGGLDKNIVPLLSRTNLSAIFKGLPADEKHWLTRHDDQVGPKLYAKTGRRKDSTVFTDPTQTIVYKHIGVTVEQFVKNVFEADDDGITGLKEGPGRLGGFHRMGAENIDPRGRGKLGPIFELRNMEATNIQDTDRFKRSQWKTLGEYQATVLAALNALGDEQAKTDVAVKVDEGEADVQAELKAW